MEDGSELASCLAMHGDGASKKDIREHLFPVLTKFVKIRQDDSSHIHRHRSIQQKKRTSSVSRATGGSYSPTRPLTSIPLNSPCMLLQLFCIVRESLFLFRNLDAHKVAKEVCELSFHHIFSVTVSSFYVYAFLGATPQLYKRFRREKANVITAKEMASSVQEVELLCAEWLQ